jgi:hypothetical protein
MTSEEKPETKGVATSPEAGVEESQGSWHVEVLDTVKDIQRSQVPSANERVATHFKIERPDGTSQEVEAAKTILKLKNEDGMEIEVPASVVHHIMSLHLKGEEAGSRIKGESLELSIRVVADHLPRKLEFKGGEAAFEVELRQIFGTEGVSSLTEMVEKGVATKEDLEALATARDEVFRLNVEGTDDEKRDFVGEFNERASGNVTLDIRSGAITPFFRVEKQPTSKMFLAISKEKDADGSEHYRMRTMAPGRSMGKLPTDRKFIGQITSEGVAQGTSVADLWREVREGGALSNAEIALVDEQREAQERWWNAGFVVDPKEN